MPLKYKEVNPLSIFNMRRINFCPPHFESITFNLLTEEKVILDWVYENTDGRFFVGAGLNSEKTALGLKVAFEIHAEASFFTLILNTINKQKEWF